MRIVAAEDHINDIQYNEGAGVTQNVTQQQTMQTEQTDNLIPIQLRHQESHQNPFVQKLLQPQK